MPLRGGRHVLICTRKSALEIGTLLLSHPLTNRNQKKGGFIENIFFCRCYHVFWVARNESNKHFVSCINKLYSVSNGF